MSYGPTSPLGGIRIFYYSTYTLGLWPLFYSGEMILLNLTLGSRNYFLPESPSLQMIAWCTEGFQRYTLMFSRDFVPVAFAIPYHRNIPMDNTYTCHSYFCALQFFTTWIPLQIITRTYWVFIHPQLFICFIWYFEILSDHSRILFKTIALHILVCLHYGCFP